MCKEERRRGENNWREKRKGGEVEGRVMEKKKEKGEMRDKVNKGNKEKIRRK